MPFDSLLLAADLLAGRRDEGGERIAEAREDKRYLTVESSETSESSSEEEEGEDGEGLRRRKMMRRLEGTLVAGGCEDS